jgi:hypothetical protein
MSHDIQHTHVIDSFLADNLTSSFLTSQNITTRDVTFKTLTLDGNLVELDPDAPNFDFNSVTLDYKDIWKPKWSSYNKAFLLDKRERGAFLANGKIGLLASFDTIDTQKTYITTHLQYNSGTYNSNTIEPFSVNSIKFFHTNTDDQLVFTNKQALNIKSSILESEHKVIDKIDGQYINVNVDLFAPRQIPYSTMQTVTITRQETQENLKKIMMYHEAYCKENIQNVSFNNNVIHHTKGDGENVATYVLSGKGYTNGHGYGYGNGKDNGNEVAFATVYVVEQPSRVKNVGFNIYQENPSKCYNSFEIDFFDESTNTNTNEITIHIFSSIMTDFDFEHPLDEAKRLAMTIYMGQTSPLSAMNKVRTDHVLAWNKLWQTNITISPKSGLPQLKEKNIENLNRIIRMSLYNIYSASRETLNANNTNGLSMIDVDGTIINDGDLWLLPLMLFIKPTIARSMLDFRFKMLNTAQQIAGSYGYQGAKFPYIDSISNTKDGIKWNVLTPLSVFNNAVIAVNTWNYYRISKDKDWLISVGYPILKSITEFLISIMDINEDDNSYHIKNVIGINGSESKQDNSFTNHFVRLAIRFTIEASYELSYFVRDEWLDAYLGLKILFVDESIKKVIKMDSLSLEEDTYRIIEMFFLLIPYFSSLFFEDNDLKGSYPRPEVIIANINYYISKIKKQYEYHPYNIALLSILYGLYSQYDDTKTIEFEDYLNRFLQNYVSGVWSNISTFSTRKVDNSFNMNAMLLMIILQGMTESRVKGGVSETGFYYDEMKIRLNIDMKMPSHWANIRCAQIGVDKTNFFTRNNTLYDASLDA